MSALSELYKGHREASDKYTYFLLAASGAAIAFAATQTQTASISWSKMPLAIAVLLWGASFYSGCKQILEVNNLLQQNYQFLRVQEGIHPDFPNHPALVQQISQILNQQSENSGRWGRRQFHLLIAGSLFYLTWHVTEMILRT